jgi:hypothetical protein
MRAAFNSAESLVDDVVGEKGVFDDVIASLKEDPDGPQIDIEQELVNCLGRRVSVVSDYAAPIGVDSERLVIAIEATDEASVRAAVAKSMSTDRDMRKVEFDGHMIWEQIDRSDAIPQLEIETPGLARRHADDEDDDRGRRRIREREEKLLPHSAVTVAKGHLLIASHRAAQARFPNAKATRPVLIHGHTLREDQVDPLRELGIFPSLFPMHTFYWGDFHRDSVLGAERAENISPTGWLMSRQMPFTSHHDAPVARPDSMRVLSATVTRRSRSGDIIGPRHRVPVATALKAMTLWAAHQHFEEAEKGSIEIGKLADFTVLSDNPMTVDPERLAELRVLETIKEGVSVYRAA